jgi:hypothetical protein
VAKPTRDAGQTCHGPICTDHAVCSGGVLVSFDASRNHRETLGVWRTLAQ